jgi:hypothetical protein
MPIECVVEGIEIRQLRFLSVDLKKDWYELSFGT